MNRSFILASIAALLTATSAIAQLSCEQTTDGTCSSVGHYIEQLDGRINAATHSVTLVHSPAAEEPIRLFAQGRENITVPFTIKQDVLTLGGDVDANERLYIEYYSTPVRDNQKVEATELRRQVIRNAIERESDLLLRQSGSDVDAQPRSTPKVTISAAQLPRPAAKRESRAFSLLEDDISAQTLRDSRNRERAIGNRSVSAQGVDGLGDEVSSNAAFKALNPNRRRSAVDELEGNGGQRSLRSGSRAIDMLVQQVRTQQSNDERRP